MRWQARVYAWCGILGICVVLSGCAGQKKVTTTATLPPRNAPTAAAPSEVEVTPASVGTQTTVGLPATVSEPKAAVSEKQPAGQEERVGTGATQGASAGDASPGEATRPPQPPSAPAVVVLDSPADSEAGEGLGQSTLAQESASAAVNGSASPLPQAGLTKESIVADWPAPRVDTPTWMIGLGEVGQIAYSQDGEHLAVSGEGNAIRVIDIPTRSVDAAFPSNAVVISFAAGGRLLFAQSSVGVEMWGVSERLLLRRFETASGAVPSADGTLLALNGGAEVSVVDVATGTLVWTRNVTELVREAQLSSRGDQPTDRSLYLAVSANNRLLACATKGGRLLVLDAGSGRLLAGQQNRAPTGAQFTGEPVGLGFSQDGSRLYIGVDEGGVNCYEAPTLRQIWAEGAGGSAWYVVKSMRSMAVGGTAGDEFIAAVLEDTYGENMLHIMRAADGAVVHTNTTWAMIPYDYASEPFTRRLTVAANPAGPSIAVNEDNNDTVCILTISKAVAFTGASAPRFAQPIGVIPQWVQDIRSDIGGLHSPYDWKGEVEAVLSGDGTEVFTRRADRLAGNDIFVWSAADGRRVRTMANRSDTNASSRGLGFAISPSGIWLAEPAPDSQHSLPRDYAIRIWYLPTGQDSQRLAGHEAPVNSLAFSRTGNLLASCANDWTARIWDMKSWKQLFVLRGHTTVGVTCVAFSPDGSLVASGGGDRTARLWSVSDGQLAWTSPWYDQAVTAVAFSGDGKDLAVATGATVLVLDVDTRALKHAITSRFDHIADVEFSPDGHELALCGEGSAIVDVQTGWELWAVDEAATRIMYTRDGSAVLTSGGMNVRMWPVSLARSRLSIAPPAGYDSGPKYLGFFPAGDSVYALYGHSLVARDWRSMAVKWSATVTAQLLGVVPSPDGQMLAVARRSDTLLLNAGTGGIIDTVETPSGSGPVFFSADGISLKRVVQPDQIATYYRPSESQWTCTTAKLADASATARPTSLSQAGTLVLMACSDDGSWDNPSYQVRRCQDGYPVANFKEDEGRQEFGATLFVSPRETVLAHVAADGHVRAWDVASGILVFEIRASASLTYGASIHHCEACVFSADDTHIAVQVVDSWYVWDLSTGLCDGVVHARGQAAFVQSGDVLVAYTGYDGVLEALTWPSQQSGAGSTLQVSPALALASPTPGQNGSTAVVLPSTSTTTSTIPGSGLAEAARTLAGHTAAVTSVAFSPDGMLLASGAGDNLVKLWDVAAGTLVRTLAGHTGTGLVTSVAFSPDGRLLASGAWDATVKLWNPSTGELVRTLADFDNETVYAVAFSLDGKLLAARSSANIVKLVDVATGSGIRTLEGDTSRYGRAAVSSIAFSPDSLLLASGASGDLVMVWNVATGAVVRTLAGHGAEVESVVFSPDGTLLASGSRDLSVKLWDVASWNLVRTLTVGSGWNKCIAFSPDGTLIASGSNDDSRPVKLWSVSTGEMVRSLTGHRDEVNSVAFSPDGALLASGSKDQTVKLWRLAAGSIGVP